MSLEAAATEPDAGHAQLAAPVRRPGLVLVLTAACLLAAVAAVAGLAILSRAIKASPITVVQGAAELGTALEAAPWTALDEEGPAVWAILPLGCERCEAALRRDLSALDRRAALRVILVAPRDVAEPRVLEQAARVARARDPAMLGALVRGEALPGRPLADAAEIEGYVEWGRATLDRIAGIAALNGVDLRAPVYAWRTGPDWRLIARGDGYAVAQVRRELPRIAPHTPARPDS